MGRHQGRWCGATAGNKTLEALTVEAEHLTQALLMRHCVSVKCCEKTVKILNTVLDTKWHFTSQ